MATRQELIRWEERYPEIFGYLFEKQPEPPKTEWVEKVEYDFGNMFEGIIEAVRGANEDRT
jgi:hypothetical protein